MNTAAHLTPPWGEMQAERQRNEHARDECARWFTHLDRQRERTRLMQNAATLARCGDLVAAKHLREQVDRMPRVYDGANLERAVRVLIEHASATTPARPPAIPGACQDENDAGAASDPAR